LIKVKNALKGGQMIKLNTLTNTNGTLIDISKNYKFFSQNINAKTAGIWFFRIFNLNQTEKYQKALDKCLKSTKKNQQQPTLVFCIFQQFQIVATGKLQLPLLKLN
jgi:hypothetical protein